MLTYWNYFSARYLGQKGQGMVEYAVVVGVVVAAGLVLAGNNGFGTNLQALFNGLTTKAATVGQSAATPPTN